MATKNAPNCSVQMISILRSNIDQVVHVPIELVVLAGKPHYDYDKRTMIDPPLLS